MKIIVKYEVKYRPFTDKDTNKEVKIGDVIDIDIERMKTLNKHNVGRAIDVIVENEADLSDGAKQEESGKNDSTSETIGQEKYTQEKLEELTVNQLKDLAEKMKIELTKARKDEIIEEILQNQK